MLIYLLLPLTILYFFLLSRILLIKGDFNPNSEIYVNRNNITLFIWFLILLLIATFKGVDVGTDYPMYYNYFLTENYSGSEFGIYFIYDIAVKYNNFLVFSFCIYFLFLTFIYFGIKNNCPNYLISILLFILNYVYYSSFNTLRQMIAVSIIFCFINVLLANKRIKRIVFIFIILLAFLFHRSALFLFILYLIPFKRFRKRTVIPFFMLTIILYFIPEFKNHVGEIITKISGFYSQKYENNLDYFFEINKEKGIIQLLPVIVQMSIVIISLYFPVGKVKATKINSKLFYFSTNIIIINLCMYSLAGIEAIDRLQIYFSCFNIYFYSLFLHILLNSKEGKDKNIIIIIYIILFYLAYYVLRLLNNISGIVPYSFFYN